MSRFLQKKHIVTALIAIVAGIAGYGIIITSRSRPVPPAAYTVAFQDVKQAVVATGSVASQTSVNLTFKASGILSRFNVVVGDRVGVGDVLAMLDQREASVATAQGQAAVQSAQANLDKVLSGATSPEIEVARAAVAAAETSLNNARNALQATREQQRVAVANAHAALLNSGIAAIPSPAHSSTATVAASGTYAGSGEEGEYKITVMSAGGTLYYYNVSGLEHDTGITVIRGTQQPLGHRGLFLTFSTSGILTSNDTWTVSLPNPQASTYLTNLNAYRASLETRRQALVSAQASVDSAQASFEQARAQMALKAAAARPEDVKAAQAQLATAEAQLQAAYNTYNNNILRSPINGVITATDMKVGEQITSQKSLTVLNEKNLRVEANIPESSIAPLTVGQKVQMTFDAFGSGRHVEGTLVAIDPAPTVVSGVINFKVTVSLPSQPEIKPGMTANLTIVLATKPRVLAVPNRLVKTKDGKKLVSVLRNKQTFDSEITIGLVGDSYTEVLSGLKEGDVLVNPMQKN